VNAKAPTLGKIQRKRELIKGGVCWILKRKKGKCIEVEDP